jgi:hypothetical protein
MNTFFPDHKKKLKNTTRLYPISKQENRRKLLLKQLLLRVLRGLRVMPWKLWGWRKQPFQENHHARQSHIETRLKKQYIAYFAEADFLHERDV